MDDLGYLCQECQAIIDPEEEAVQVRSGHLSRGEDGDPDFEPESEIAYMHGTCYDAGRPLSRGGK